MSIKILERSAVTTGLVANLRTLDFPVGDNNSPTDIDGAYVPFGWNGEPDAAGKNFTPWLSVTPMPAAPAGAGAPSTIESMSSDGFWVCNYSLYAAGVNRNQCEKLLDRARNLLCNLGVDSPFTVEGETATWTIGGVKCLNLGSNQRVGEAIPYYYTQTDSYQLWATEGD